MVSAVDRALVNQLLALFCDFLRSMFKKLLLATIIVMLGLWGAGYDVTSANVDIKSAADKQAGNMSGRNALDKSDWGRDN